MSTELFSEDVGRQDSPRLVWSKKHAIRTHHAEHMCGPEDEPYCCWLPDNDAKQDLGRPIPDNADDCGYGKTEEQAMVALAQRHGIPLWNEATQ